MTSEKRNINIAFLAMDNLMSREALKGIIAAGTLPSNIFLSSAAISVLGSPAPSAPYNPPHSSMQLPVIQASDQETISTIARKHDITIFHSPGGYIKALDDFIDTVRPRVVCVACFPSIIPGALIDKVSSGFINLHPSLLPSHRGPAPLFWIFRSKDQSASGVTIHFMDRDLDSGDIILQQRIQFADGISGLEAERICGDLGGKLLAQASANILTGIAESYPQHGKCSYETWPSPLDFDVPLEWEARRAFNFMRGTAHWNQPYRIEVDGNSIFLSEALEYTSEDWLREPLLSFEEGFYVRFASGVLKALKS